MKKISALLFALSACAAVCGQSLIPQPVSVEKKEGFFRLTPDLRVFYFGNEIAPLAEYLAGYLPGCRTAQGIPSLGRSSEVIRLAIHPEWELPAEGYRIEVGPRRVWISGKDYGGLFNGIQTFLQLLPAEVYDKTPRDFDRAVECIAIEDYPRFGYRGVMLDAARTFIPKEDMLRQIDFLAYHRMNKLHWHLADDEGWRIEIESYPELAAVGGFRGGDSPVKPIYGAWDVKYGGYYTQDDIREIVAYAAVRNIEVIPEIDLPGHSRTAAIIYPEIVCDYTPDLTPTSGYDRRNVWCVAREENYAMLENILTEIAGLFPSGRIHLGGDEVEPEQWSRCPHCKELMAKEGIKETVELEDVFMNRVIGIVHGLGKEAGVWAEASYRDKPDRSTWVYSWKNDLGIARKAAAAGYPTVVMPGRYFYFDMRQSPGEVGHIWAGIVSPETVYSFDFDAEGFTAAEMENVKGMEAAFFSELLLSNGMDFLDYQLYPRVCALSELTWTPQSQRSWSDFEGRMTAAHYARMDAMGIKYRTPPAEGAKDGRAKLTPAVAFSSSLKEAQRYPYSNLTAYKGSARTNVTCGGDDWFLFEFAAPLTCESVKIMTGYEHLPRAGIPAGYVEFSYDGKTFEKMADLSDLGAVIGPVRSLKAIRIVSEAKGNGEPFVIIQPLEIR